MNRSGAGMLVVAYRVDVRKRGQALGCSRVPGSVQEFSRAIECVLLYLVAVCGVESAAGGACAAERGLGVEQSCDS